MAVVARVVAIVKDQEHGSITQRFALAVLQKSSVSEAVIQTLLELEMVPWVLLLLKRSFITEINPFCLDFASALLANIMHSKVAQTHFAAHPDTTRQLVDTLLRYIREQMQVSVLMHLLICLNYIYRDPFKPLLAEVSFRERVSEFAKWYDSGLRSAASDIDRKTVLDLCAHIFHNKPREDGPGPIDPEDHNELIFECFQDEVTS